MERQNPNLLPKIDLFPRLAAVGRFVGSLVRHLPDSGFPSDYAHDNDVPEDTLISEPGLYTPQWKQDLPPMEYADPTHPIRVAHDSEGNYHNPDGEAVA